jgi:hypothetical protein
MDSEAPRCKKSMTDTVLPMRAIPRIAIVEPKNKKSKTDIEEPNCDNPKTDKEEPQRPNVRNDIELPIWT